MLSGKRNGSEEDELVVCNETMDSVLLQGHTHTCSGRHLDGGHQCSSDICRRWFWKKGTLV